MINSSASSLRSFFIPVVRRFPWLIKLSYYAYRWFQRRYSVGVVGLIWNPRGEVLLVEHVFHPNIPWGLPGGWIGRDEDPALAVIREFKEELGLEITVSQVVLVERTQPQHLDMAFACQAHSGIGDLSYELISYRWYSPQQLPRLHKFHYDAIIANQPREVES